MGAELVRFSPIHDRELPEDLDGLLLSGGYPELNGEALEENQEMCTRIREVILDGMPCLAECGGFMYLHQEMEDMEGKQRRVCGVIPGRAYRTPKLNRFGYITLTENRIPDLVRSRLMNSIILIPQIAERIFMRQSRHLKEDGIVSMTGTG